MRLGEASEQDMTERIAFDARYNGPPASAHGGYACGVLGGLLGTIARVSLRRPPPLDRPLDVRRMSQKLELCDAETVIAQAEPATVVIDPPKPVSLLDAERAARAYPGFESHIFPTCFGCGPARSVGDGLRIFSSRVPGRELVAAPWMPDATLVGSDGRVKPEFVWAALDCPGGWAVAEFQKEPRIVLGQLAVEEIRPLPGSEPCIVVGWAVAKEGRKCRAGTAIFSINGLVHAIGEETWITVA
jgi:hypothetical protein